MPESANHERDASFELAIVRRRLAGSINESPELSHLSPAELNELASALVRRGTAQAFVQRYVKVMLAAQTVLESGSTSQEEITKAGNAVDQPTSTPTPLPGQTP